MVNNDYIGWINQRAMRGKNFFTKEDFRSAFQNVSDISLSVALNRLADGQWIMSPWQNFYVVMPIQYKLKGVVPPSFYIDDLMSFLGRNYYVSLLSAAALNGAGHQRSMSFFVTADGAPLRNGVRNGTKILLSKRKTIDMRWVRQVRTEGGYMNVSAPLMTILDLIMDENKIGGLSRAAEVIAELTETLVFDETYMDLFRDYSPSVLQRLGHILSNLGQVEMEDKLFAICTKMGLKFRYVKLKASKESLEGDLRDDKWKVIINEKIEIDEL